MLAAINGSGTADTASLASRLLQINTASGPRTEDTGKADSGRVAEQRFVADSSSDLAQAQKIPRISETDRTEQSLDMYDQVALPPRPLLEMAREAYEKLNELIDGMQPQKADAPDEPGATTEQPTDTAVAEIAEDKTTRAAELRPDGTGNEAVSAQAPAKETTPQAAPESDQTQAS